jgi:hypothetical protein
MKTKVLVWILALFISINTLRAAHHALNNDDWQVAVLFVILAYFTTYIPLILRKHEDN